MIFLSVNIWPVDWWISNCFCVSQVLQALQKDPERCSPVLKRWSEIRGNQVTSSSRWIKLDSQQAVRTWARLLTSAGHVWDKPLASLLSQEPAPWRGREKGHEALFISHHPSSPQRPSERRESVAGRGWRMYHTHQRKSTLILCCRSF